MASRYLLNISGLASGNLCTVTDILENDLKASAHMIIADGYQAMRQALILGTPIDHIPQFVTVVFETAKSYAIQPGVVPVDVSSVPYVAPEPDAETARVRVQIALERQTMHQLRIMAAVLDKGFGECFEWLTGPYISLLKALAQRGFHGTECEYLKTQCLNAALRSWT